MLVFRVSGGKLYYGTSRYCTGSLRLTLGFGAALPPDLTEYPRVAHIPACNYTGYVVVYDASQRMTCSGKERPLPGGEGTMSTV